MTLRTRVIAGLGLAFALVLGAAIALGISQRAQLIGQLDDRLQAVTPFGARGPTPSGGVPSGELPSGELPSGNLAPPDPGSSPNDAISDIYLAQLDEDGSVTVVSQGQLLEDAPDIEALTTTPVVDRSFATVESSNGSTSFRVLLSPTPNSEISTIAAIPTTDVDDTMRQLTLTLAAVVLLIGAALAAVALWVLRLGVRPITDMTATAEAIASGERNHRAPVLDEHTEAGQLAAALNSMLDQRDQADDALRRFVSDASHELRTPLTSISGYLELYSQGGFRGEGQLDDAVRRMSDESKRMTDLVESLLVLARNDEAQTLDLHAVDLNELVADIVADFHSSRGFEQLTFDAPPAGELNVQLDRNKIKQLLIGLVDNAIVHAPGAAVHIDASRSDSDVILSVSDDGPGMSKQEADRAFERFSRGDPARARTSGGSGLGLAIARSLAEAHGGSITLDTALGKGCTFKVMLPL